MQQEYMDGRLSPLRRYTACLHGRWPTGLRLKARVHSPFPHQDEIAQNILPEWVNSSRLLGWWGFLFCTTRNRKRHQTWRMCNMHTYDTDCLGHKPCSLHPSNQQAGRKKKNNRKDTKKQHVFLFAIDKTSTTKWKTTTTTTTNTSKTTTTTTKDAKVTKP